MILSGFVGRWAKIVPRLGSDGLEYSARDRGFNR
jgi:hypothetical protein